MTRLTMAEEAALVVLVSVHLLAWGYGLSLLGKWIAFPRWLIPNALTTAGLCLGVIGVVRGVSDGWPWLVASIAFDLLDGLAARRLDAVTAWGKAYDWSTDVALAHALVWRTFAPSVALAGSVLLVVWQSAAIALQSRTSGRVALWALCIGTAVLR